MVQATAISQNEALECAHSIFDMLSHAKIGQSYAITFHDYDPADSILCTAEFAHKFGYPAGSEPLIREALVILDGMGVDVDSEVVREPIPDSHGGMYPAELRWTVRLR